MNTIPIDSFQYLVIALFRAPLRTVHSELEQLLGHEAYEIHDGPLATDWVYKGRPPRGGAHLRRVLLYEPASNPGTTAMIANLEDGWMTLVNILAGKISGEHLLVRSIDDDQYPLGDLEVWTDGKSERYVRAMRDPKWEFYERGQARAFEDVECYRAKRIRDRVNRRVLLQCLRKAGWDLESPQFWESRQPSVYVTERPRAS